MAAATVLAVAAPLGAQQPAYLRDRGPGVRTSLLGTYVRKGEFLVYPFFEWYADNNLEYKPVELGYGNAQTDYRGRYRASEGILFVSYGISNSVSVEFEVAVISAELETAANDTSSGKVPKVSESGLGDVEGQIRWRFQHETETRPELFTYFETVFPLQKDKHIIGTQEWEYAFGLGLVRGYRWGTLTVRVAGEYIPAEKPQFDAGEYAIEYLRRLSPAWRIVGAIEGVQVDEISVIGEAQWTPSRRVMFKFNAGVGLTPNATDFAPEIGVLFSF